MQDTNRKEYYAHVVRDENGNIIRKQTVEEHCSGTAELAGKFGEAFGCGEHAALIGKYHDIGKYSEEYQERLLCYGPKCDHSTAGGYELNEVGDQKGSFCIMGHHSGLPDMGGKSDHKDKSTWRGRICRAETKGGIPLLAEHEHPSTYKSEICMEGDEEKYSDAFETRMLYSCLVDADYLDTERFMLSKERRYGYSDIDTLLERFHDYIGKWGTPTTDLNKIRKKILDNCIEKGRAVDNGMYSLTVPTSGGKTTASLGFALEHAKARGKERIIYVVPYTSIIEQNADVFRKILGSENVLEHHSSYEGYKGEKEDEYAKEQLAAENWDAPVIVTTAVRFMESLYANKPSKCRRVHNIANAVLIFDEAQQIPVDQLKPCVWAISELVKKYKATAVLCTATCPAFDTIFDKIEITELEPDKEDLYEKLRRTNLKRIKGKQGPKDLAKLMEQHNKVLCIVNSRKAALQVYNDLPAEGRYLLSTYLYSKHRRNVLAKIKEDLLDSEKPVRLISTSLIEAGVDIDFPVVYREVAGLDSVLQAAGRCNREGKRNPADSVVYVFERDGFSPLLSLFGKNISAFNMIANRHPDDLDSLAAIKSYFEELYKLVGDNMDRDNAVKAFLKDLMPFATVAKKFHLIHDDSYTVYVEEEDSKEAIDLIRKGQADRDTYRKLGPYTVSVKDDLFYTLYQNDFLELLNEETGVIKRDPAIYSDETGLDVLKFKEM